MAIPPAPTLLFMCSSFRLSLPFETLWGLRVMACSFYCSKQNRGVEVFSIVLVTSVCPCLCSVVGCQERGEGGVFWGVRDAILCRELGKCSLGCCLWAITHGGSWKGKEKSPPPTGAITSWITCSLVNALLLLTQSPSKAGGTIPSLP